METTALFKVSCDELLRSHALVHQDFDVFQFAGSKERRHSSPKAEEFRRVLTAAFPDRFGGESATDPTGILVDDRLDTAWIVSDATNQEPCGVMALKIDREHVSPGEDSRAHVHWVGVSPEHRRRGVASVLAAHCAVRARQLGYDDLYAFSTTATEGTRAFFRDLGFRELAF